MQPLVEMLDNAVTPFAVAFIAAGILLGGCATGNDEASSPSFLRSAAACNPETQACPASQVSGNKKDAGAKDGAAPKSPVPVPKKADAGTIPPITSGADAAVASDGGTPPVVPAGECGSSATEATCFTCCDTKSPGGFTVHLQAFGDCNCASPGTCDIECAATFCAGQAVTSGSACDTCLGASTACSATADTACAGSAACTQFATCYADSKCGAKP